MTRFFVEPEELNQNTLCLTGENAQHARVLRLREGEQVLLCDGLGMEALCRVEDAAFNLTVLERRTCATEAAVKVSVYMAFPKADKLEHVIQKATELGAFEIIAFPSARCVSKPDEKSLKKKLERWQKIAASAGHCAEGRCAAFLQSRPGAVLPGRQGPAVLRKRTRRHPENGSGAGQL